METTIVHWGYVGDLFFTFELLETRAACRSVLPRQGTFTRSNNFGFQANPKP